VVADAVAFSQGSPGDNFVVADTRAIVLADGDIPYGDDWQCAGCMWYPQFF